MPTPEELEKMIKEKVTAIPMETKEKVFHIFKKSLYEPDGTQASSSRVFGAIIIVVVCMCQFFLTGVVGWKIVFETDVDKLRVLIGSFRYMMYAYLILVATALTLYGTNVWKFIAEIKNGRPQGPQNSVDSPDGSEKKSE